VPNVGYRIRHPMVSNIIFQFFSVNWVQISIFFLEWRNHPFWNLDCWIVFKYALHLNWDLSFQMSRGLNSLFAWRPFDALLMFPIGRQGHGSEFVMCKDMNIHTYKHIYTTQHVLRRLKSNFLFLFLLFVLRL
jgi:hypothetical protein